MRFEAQQGKTLHQVEVHLSLESAPVSAETDGHQAQVRILSAGPPCVVSVDGRVFEVRLAEDREAGRGAPGAWVALALDPGLGAVAVQIRSETLVGPQSAAGNGNAESHQLKSPIPGRVLRVLVKDGDEVRRGQAVLVVEAMKMENELFAPRDGTISDLRVKPGDAVDAQALLLSVLKN